MSAVEDDPATLRYVAGVDRQAGALAWQEAEGERKFWIVTSRRTRRWVLPKGSVDPGMTPAEAAAQEAFEEAGLHGQVSLAPIGSYTIPKIRPPLIWSVNVAIFPIAVTQVDEDWLESGERERRLVSLGEAEGLIEEQEILRLLRAAVPSLSTNRSAPT